MLPFAYAQQPDWATSEPKIMRSLQWLTQAYPGRDSLGDALIEFNRWCRREGGPRPGGCSPQLPPTTMSAMEQSDWLEWVVG